MTIVGVAAVRGAPGVTTTSLLVAAAMPDAVLVEADASGGVLAARYGLGREPGLTTMLAEARSGGTIDWRAHAQSAGGVAVVVGPDSPEAAQVLWQQSSDRIARVLRSLDATVVADLGRVGPHLPLAGALDVLVLLVRGTREHLVTASHRLAALRAGARAVAVVVVGDGDYSALEVAQSLGVGVLAALPDDPAAARILEGHSPARSLARTRLVRACQGLAGRVVDVTERSVDLAAVR
jgi:hypothetical protein